MKKENIIGKLVSPRITVRGHQSWEELDSDLRETKQTVMGEHGRKVCHNAKNEEKRQACAYLAGLSMAVETGDVRDLEIRSEHRTLWEDSSMERRWERMEILMWVS
jgi:hypothetical protein